MWKLISVIVPVWNVEKYLNRCVDSIINQTYKNLEIILVDDGSPDNCPAICDEYAKKDNRVKVIHRQNGGAGPSEVRNNGIRVATGDYIAFVDGDDYLDCDYFENLYDESKDLIVCGYRIHKKHKIQIKQTKYCKHITDINSYLAYSYEHEYFIPIWNKLYKSSIIKDIKFDKNFKYGEDFLFNVKVIEKCKKIKIVKNAFYNYIEYNNNSWSKITDLNYKNQVYDIQYEIMSSKLSDKKHLEQVNVFYIKLKFFLCRAIVRNKDIDMVEKLDMLKAIRENNDFKNALKHSKSYNFRMLIIKNILNIGSNKILYKLLNII